MSGPRSSLPLRLRQLLSGEGAHGPSLKLESEPPPEVKGFIDKVIKSPLQDIAIPLSGFRWEYNKGNFHHWTPLFLHFDTYFKTYVSGRKDLLLSDNLIENSGTFPKHAVLQILRVMQIILENCHGKSSFSSLEHFKALLATTDPEILIASLETLSALVKINPSKLHVSGKLIGCGSLNNYLLSLAQGWGSKEEGLGLYNCVMANEKNQEEHFSLFPSDIQENSDKSQFRLGSTLHFEFYTENLKDKKQHSSNLHVIHIPDLHLHMEDDLTLLNQLVSEFNVPQEHRFSLLTRIRYARAFRSPKTCRLYSRICLLAFIVLVQSNDAHDELVSFFANEPEYTNELIRLVRSEEAVPGTIRTLAMLALGAQLAAYSSSHERARVLSGSSIISASGNRMVLLSVLQKAVHLLNANASDPSSLSFVEALLQFYLLHVISSSSSGSAIRGSGMVPTLLPLLEDSDSAHMGLVCSAVKTLQKLMDYSNAAVSLFKDLGGVELLAHRLKTEVDRVNCGSNDLMVTGDSSKSGDFLYAQKRLIKALLKALGSATYAPANSGRAPNSPDNCLISSLSVIFHNVNKFGGDIYFSAVNVMSEIIHKDPTCFAVLHEMGLPDAFLSSVKAGILPSSKALTCVPSGLGAICLNAKGLEAVKETAALRFLVDTFTGKKYVVAMNEGVVPLANAVEELLRHVSSLRSTGVEIIIEIVEKLALMGEATSGGSSMNVDGISAMETDSHDNLFVSGEPTLDGISNERFIQLCIFHLMVLVHRIMENTETCRLFVEKKGIEALMKLLLRPSIAQSSEGMSIALHSTLVFKGFTQYHSGPLAQAFCSSLRDHLKKALSGISSVGGSFLLAPGSAPDSGIFSSLFVVEFLLFLAASKDTRWVTALLSEFGDGSQDVLIDIGRVHREILWQIALLDDSKIEVGGNAPGSGDSRKLEASAASGPEDQRFNSFRQFIDPLLRRRSSGWSVESQFFDLINLYRDLGRGSGFHQRSGIEGSSSVRPVSTHQSSSEDGGTSSKTEDQQRPYYTSCCDMLRSLSFHISHLFLELGKVMLLPSRRRDDAINIPPSTKAVVSTIASIVLDHLNFVGVADPSNSEGVISTKCRFLGKVVDFVDSILLERAESCNPILVNCFYGQGVVQTILTTFEATSQLLFAVNRGGPPSPMDTDDGNLRQDEKGENNNSWIYGPLASYGNLMDHLVTSSFIISPFTKNLLAQPLFSFSIPFPRDPETFVKVLQSKVLKAVLPIWNDPQFSECSYEFIAVIISIVRHIYSGVEVKNVNISSGSRVTGPPPDESAISMFVEMGFPRPRAEEALRQVGTNSVEMAMEWLFAHPEEIQEDDELARALAMSLGSSDTSMKDDAAGVPESTELEEEVVQLPSVDELLSTCIKLLQMKEPLAFPVRDFLVMICSQNDGHYRDKVVTFILDHVKLSSGNNVLLSALFHVLALVLHDDSAAREVALKGGLVKVALEVLSQWEPSLSNGDKPQVPKWVTVAFLAIDRMLQVDPKQNSEISSAEQSKKDDASNKTPVISDDNSNSLRTVLGVNPRIIDLSEQKRLIEIACRCIHSQLPFETMHVILQLCATLTKVHSVAITFLEAGGLSSLLSLPTSSLFTGFDSVAATIVRHILEDPQTLQQAMETEIRHSMLGATSRLSNGRITPRHFLQNLSAVVLRDPEIFLLAAKSVCEVEMVGERPHVVLLKDREKDKSKEKENDKDKQAGSDGKVKLSDSNVKGGKTHRKPPHSFVSVIEFLLDAVLTFVPPLKDDSPASGISPSLSLADMEIDGTPSSKAKGKAIATATEESNSSCQDASASLAKTVFILKLLTEIFLTYASSVHILLRRDTEISNSRGPIHRNNSGNSGGGNGIFHHVIHNFLPYPGSYKKDGSKKLEGDWRHKLASRASQFLVAASIRSSESRKRVFLEINSIFNELVDTTDGYRVPDCNINAYVDLLNDILAARSPTGSYISAEASATFIDVGLVHSLTGALRILDLDHPESSKIASGIVKALESVTKEHVHAADHSSSKEPGSSNPASDENPSSIPAENDDNNRFQVLETVSQPDQNEVAPVHLQSFNGVQASGSSDSNTDDMDHDHDLDGNEDDFMHETTEEGGGLVNGNISSVEISFDISHNLQENSDEDEDDDEEMTGEEGDDGDEDEDEEEEENNNLEEDEVHHMSHPDTDQDDHEIDEDEFDEDLLEEEDEDDEDDEDGVILRLEESINGINVLEQIEVLGRDNNFANEGLHVMPVEVFGSRRRGRTTSIYNLLGRGTDHGTPLQHPLLIEPSSSNTVAHRPTDAASDDGFSDRGIENSLSRLDAIFRTLRNGRHGHRLNMWLDESQPRSSGSSGPVIPQGFEELLVSQLRRPSKHQVPDQNTALQPQDNGDTNKTRDTEELREEIAVEANDNAEVITVASCNEGSEGVGNVEMGPADNDMQFERSDAAVRDVEAVSQESGGSGATLGESLRSLEVEIGSADGHDDGGERQGPSERVRRVTASSGTATPTAGRDASLLQSVSEAVPLSNPELNTTVGVSGEQQREVDAGAIDPAFLEALPEELRAEVLSAQQNQVAQPSGEQNQAAGDIDPDFLAALPPDIRAEVLAQQQAQRLHQSQELEGQPVEMDTVSIIATFPSDLREEVLLTSSDAILANLTPALVAEANMLRERFAHRYSRNFLGMYPRNRRGESSRRTDGIGSSLERAIGSIGSRRVGGKVIEADGAPLVDQEDLKAMIRLLRVVQPLYKGQLQRLLLNLCAHSETRTSLVQILMGMLMLDIQGPGKCIISSEEQPYRLYACQSHVMYSRPQYSNGVPPLVSRRILETLTYLARNHPYVAKLLLNLELPRPNTHNLDNLDQTRGKAVMVMEEDENKAVDFTVVLLLGLLNLPLYLRSIAHLEQLLSLLEVVIDNVDSNSGQSKKSSSSEEPSGSRSYMADSQLISEASKPASDPSVSLVKSGMDTSSVLCSLPHSELRLLCSLLARDGLSDNAYVLVAEVLKKLVSIAPTHCHLFMTELAESVQALSQSAMKELSTYGEAEKVLITTASTDGTAVLRVLQALSSLVSLLHEKEKEHPMVPDKDSNDALSQVLEISSTLEPLWMELSSCISKIENSPEYGSEMPSTSSGSYGLTSSSTASPLPAGTQNILPYIESFFVTCEKLHPGQSGSGYDTSAVVTFEHEEAATGSSLQKSSSLQARVDEKQVAFVKFSEKHRKLLNAFIRQNPGLLEKSFSLMLQVPRFIDFDNKRAHFKSKIKHQHDHHHSPLRISVRRAYILEDSYNQLRLRSTQDLKGRLTVHFQGEEGIDAGGLTREWYQLLSRVIFDKGALLFTTVGNESTFQPNPNSVYQTEHLSYFKFVGSVVGKALFDGQLLDVHFTRSFYKHILGVKVTYHDIEAIDPDYFKNLKWMLENDISDVLDLTFSMDADEEKLILYEKTEVTDYELIPGGRNTKVTEENKHQYVNLVAEHRLTTAIRPQINAFMDGFKELIPRDLISIFNDKELELLISGLPDIDLDDLRANTEYSGYSAASPVIHWFWEVVQGFSKEDKARLLQFVTGTSKVPLEGFSALQGISGSQRFQIHKAYGSASHLPSAHTCFNQLDLPEYPTKQQLQERLLMAIHEGSEGFGFG